MVNFTTFVIWIHLAAIALWVGGLFAVSIAALPVVWREVGEAKDAARIAAMILGRFQRISRELIGAIILTGFFNIINAGVARGFDYGAHYLGVVGLKIVFFVTIIVIQAWHSQRLAPAMYTLASQETIDAAAVAFLRRRITLTTVVSILLAVATILLGLSLRYSL